MNLPVYLAGLVFATLLAGGCLAAILIYFDPVSSDLAIFILFYLSLFIASTGIFTLIGLLIRRLSHRRKSPLPIGQLVRYLEVSFRQGLFLAVILVASLILQSQRILTWWHLLVLVGLVGLVEWWIMRR
jgi:phosphoglycerol transferase MdoB-like AlkP superfamily enzyme